MATPGPFADSKILASGAIVAVDPTTGVATFETCGWLIQVASGAEEIDFPEDAYRLVDCGARLYFDAPDGCRCEYGHEFGNLERRWAPYGAEWQREQMGEEDSSPLLYV